MLIRRRIVVLGVLLAMAIVPTAALASDHLEDDVDTESEDRHPDVIVGFDYDELAHLLVFALNAAEAEDPVDCTAPEDVVLERAEDPETGDLEVTVVEGDWEVPDGCAFVDVEGPNGQVNHGQVVSSFVHALKALDLSHLDVPFGQLVRQIAGSDLGQGDQKVRVGDVDEDDDEADDDEDGEEAEFDDDGNGPPPHANNDKDKVKKPKSNGSNNGNGNGPNK